MVGSAVCGAFYLSLHKSSNCSLSSLAHTPDNSFLGFVSEEAAREEAREEELDRKDRIAVVYGKQDYMWQV